MFKKIRKIWMGVGLVISWVTTRLILTVLFFLVLTPIAILARVLGKRFLDRGFDKTLDTYWIARGPVKFNQRSYENQF